MVADGIDTRTRCLRRPRPPTNLLPTADVANALLTSLPAYDLTLFAAGLQAGNLVEAIGHPMQPARTSSPVAFAHEGLPSSVTSSVVIADLQKI